MSDGRCVAQATAEASAADVGVLSTLAVGAYIGIGSGDYDALCHQHGVPTGAICCFVFGRVLGTTAALLLNMYC